MQTDPNHSIARVCLQKALGLCKYCSPRRGIKWHVYILKATRVKAMLLTNKYFK